jgi:hypothetical protein
MEQNHMHDRYNLNLGADLSCPAPVRRRYYIWMLAYLAFAGLILIEGAYQAIRRIETVREAGDSYGSLQRGFALRHDGAASPKAYADQLMGETQAQNEKIKALATESLPSIPFLPVLSEVKKLLPESVLLLEFTMTSKSLNLTLNFPVGGKDSPEMFMQQWKDSPVLTKWMGPLEVVSRVDGQNVGDEKTIGLQCVSAIKTAPGVTRKR